MPDSKYFYIVNGQKKFIPKEDIWEVMRFDKNLQRKVKVADAVKHSRVKAIASEVGITIEDFELILSPTKDNSNRCIFKFTARDKDGRLYREIGEASETNVGCTGYCGYLAFKRGEDRVILRASKLYDLYSSIEFTDGESDNGINTNNGNGGDINGNGDKQKQTDIPKPIVTAKENNNSNGQNNNPPPQNTYFRKPSPAQQQLVIRLVKEIKGHDITNPSEFVQGMLGINTDPDSRDYSLVIDRLYRMKNKETARVN